MLAEIARERKTQVIHDSTPPDGPEVKILNIQHKRGGSLRALVDIQIGDLRINGLQVHAPPKEDAYVTWPDCRGRNGGYEHYIRPLTPELHHDVEDAVFSAWLGVK
jgi:DNA-binding cell septation regulator SpoVG